jgi:hypothetical protein
MSQAWIEPNIWAAGALRPEAPTTAVDERAGASIGAAGDEACGPFYSAGRDPEEVGEAWRCASTGGDPKPALLIE